MVTSVFLAKVMGVIFTIAGLSIFLNMKCLDECWSGFMKNKSLMHLVGFLSLLLGLLVVLSHNMWEGSWVLVVTVVGWFTFLKGVLVMLFPSAVEGFAESLMKRSAYPLYALVAVVVGVYLGYFGFFAVV
jgi:hypothetical protein